MPNVIPAVAVTAPRSTREPKMSSGTSAAGPRLASTRTNQECDNQSADGGYRRLVQLDRRKGQSSKGNRSAKLGRAIEMPPLRIGGLREGRDRQRECRCPEGDYHKENATPAETADQHATKCRADRHCHPVARGPDAECAAAFARIEPDDTDDRQRSWNEEGRPETGQRPSNNQDRRGRRQGAPNRSGG
jgi:hypothetical protein